MGFLELMTSDQLNCQFKHQNVTIQTVRQFTVRRLEGALRNTQKTFFELAMEHCSVTIRPTQTCESDQYCPFKQMCDSCNTRYFPTTVCITTGAQAGCTLKARRKWIALKNVVSCAFHCHSVTHNPTVEASTRAPFPFRSES